MILACRFIFWSTSLKPLCVWKCSCEEGDVGVARLGQPELLQLPSDQNYCNCPPDQNYYNNQIRIIVISGPELCQTVLSICLKRRQIFFGMLAQASNAGFLLSIKLFPSKKNFPTQLFWQESMLEAKGGISTSYFVLLKKKKTEDRKCLFKSGFTKLSICQIREWLLRRLFNYRTSFGFSLPFWKKKNFFQCWLPIWPSLTNLKTSNKILNSRSYFSNKIKNLTI